MVAEKNGVKAYWFYLTLKWLGSGLAGSGRERTPSLKSRYCVVPVPHMRGHLVWLGIISWLYASKAEVSRSSSCPIIVAKRIMNLGSEFFETLCLKSRRFFATYFNSFHGILIIPGLASIASSGTQAIELVFTAWQSTRLIATDGARCFSWLTKLELKFS